MKWSVPDADRYFAPILEKDPRGFQIDHLDAALKHCRRFRRAIDGGAHIGTWSVELGRRFECVVAFEPAPDTYECLCRNIDEAKCSNVFPMRYALAHKTATARIVNDDARKGNTGSRYLDLKSRGDGDDTVKTTSLDNCDFEDVDFLKLDVEGSEASALRGATRTIEQCRPLILIEVKKLRATHDPELAVQWLKDHDYREIERIEKDRVFVPKEWT